MRTEVTYKMWSHATETDGNDGAGRSEFVSFAMLTGILGTMLSLLALAGVSHFERSSRASVQDKENQPFNLRTF